MCNHVGHLSEGLVMTGEGESQIGFLNLSLLFRAQIRKCTVDLVHSRVLRVVFWVQEALDATISRELLPIIDFLENVIHSHGNLPSGLADNAWMVILSSSSNEYNSEVKIDTQ